MSTVHVVIDAVVAAKSEIVAHEAVKVVTSAEAEVKLAFSVGISPSVSIAIAA